MDNTIEVYRQRYETFRHLDKIRWHMLQLLIAVVTATVLVLRVSTNPLEWWFYALVGLGLMGISQVMLSVGAGIRANAIVLRRAAESLGDDGIPDVSDKWKAVSHWIAIGVMATGAGLFIWPLWQLIF